MRGLLALIAGLGFALGQPPFSLWPVALVALVSLFLLWRHSNRPALIGWLFGLGYFGLSMHWVLEPFQVDAAETGWMAPFALFGLAGGLALFWAFAGWLGKRLGGDWGFAVALTSVELARAYVLTGFPWGLVGYVWAETPAAQWHAVIGPHGVTLATSLLAFVTARALATRSVPFAVVSVGLLAALLGGGYLLVPAETDLSDRPVVRLIQPNAPQHLKWERDHIPTFFNRKINFTARLPRPDLIVWPEASITNLLHNAEPTLEVITNASAGVPSVLGIMRIDEDRLYNSIVTLGSDGTVNGLYDKHHLVPFGEYMPFPDLFARFNILGLAVRAESGQSAGPGAALLDLGPLGKALPLICYEAVFPQDVGATSDRPDFILHLTNDAWFGKFAGPQQHFQQARLRAIEQGLPVLRAANTGISAVIDPAGRVLDALPLGEAGYLDVPIPQPRRATLYSQSGDWPVALLLFVALMTLARRFARNPH